MNRIGKIAAVAALIAAIAGVVALKHRPRPAEARGLARPALGLPRLVELDAVDCGPCEAMASVLAELQGEYAGRLAIERVDVREHRDVEAAYRVRFTPTQVFLDESGAELWRHEGFLPKEAILAQWRELGRDLGAPAVSESRTGFLAGLFGALGRALGSTPLIALFGAFAWGILSVLLSPCHLANIPLVVGFIHGQGRISTPRAFGLSAVFATGVLTMIAAIGGATVAAGRLAGDIGSLPSYLVAAVLFAVGLHLIGVLPMPWSGWGLPAVRRKGVLAALIFGLLFGVALGPCTFAYMAPMLGVAFQVASARPGGQAGAVYGALLLGAYGVGHCSILALAGGGTGLAQRWLDWNEQSRRREWLGKACGALVLLAGLYLIGIA